MGSHTLSDRHGSAQRLDAADPFFEEQGYTEAPTLVQWMATLRCNASCAHCLTDSKPVMPARFADMELPAVRRLVAQVAELGVTELLVTGGEPLLRADLPEVIDLLGEHGVTWSLNTAALPTPDQRRAMERHPPALAAVSLDGPRSVHDRFRGRRGAFDESLEALQFFGSLSGCQVTAGTTVTRANHRTLRQTMQRVADSGADHWGIHLLLPEGRAAERDGLDLSRRQLDRVLSFVERARAWFPLSLCDEIGYCGDREPLLRDVPWACGAGVAQCVVLPDGSVVPCTTLDLTTSAGNLHERSLADIWHGGFGELRQPRPHGECGGCEYLRACRGGCWLQRRAGKHCYKQTWHRHGLLRSAASAAVCLGLAATSGCSEPKPTPVSPPDPGPVAVTKSQPPEPADAGAAPAATPTPSPPTGPPLEPKSPSVPGVAPGLESALLMSYAAGLSDRGPGRGGSPFRKLDRPVELPPELAADPAGKLFLDWSNKQLPPDLAGRCRAVKAALATRQRALGFSAFAWRVLAEPVFSLAGDGPTGRSPQTAKLLQETLAELRAATERWRAAHLDGKLDPYLARGRIHIRHRFEMSKAMRPTPAWVALARDTNAERWGSPGQRKAAEWALEGFLARHPYAETMQLDLTAPSPGMLHESVLGRHPLTSRGGTFGVLDLLVVPAKGTTPATVEIGFAGAKLAPVEVKVPAGAELGYADLVALADRQHPPLRQAAEQPGCTEGPRDPRLAPAMLRLAANANTPADADRVGWWLADFFLF